MIFGSDLQPQRQRGIVGKGVCPADVAKHHLDRFVASGSHDLTFCGTSSASTRHKSSAERVAGKLRFVEACGERIALHYERHCVITEALGRHLPMSIDRAEYGAGCDARELQPGLQRAYRARLRLRAVRQRYFPTLPFLIGLGPP